MSNAEEEEFHTARFLELFPACTTNLYRQKPGEPDFCIHLNGQLIGIEHTRLIRQKDGNSIDPKIQAQVVDNIMLKAEEIYSRISDIKLMVHVSFRNDYGLAVRKPVYLSSRDINELAHFIADFVSTNIPPLPKETFDFDSFDWLTGKERFPKKIRGISITNIDHLNDPCWSSIQAGTVPPIYESNELKIRLKEKSKKPANYRRKYDQIWLLIVEDGRNLTSYFHFEDQTPIEIESPYNRVFILRIADNEIIELKNSLPQRKQWPN